MDIDVVMLANSRTPELHNMTQVAIDSLHNSSGKHKFTVHLVESCPNASAYVGAESYTTAPDFNYNRAMNEGLAHCKADWIVMANNDLLFGCDWIDPILTLGCDSASPISPGWQPHADKLGKITYGYRTSIEMAGWCVVLKRSTLDKIGQLDERFQNYFQDNDLAMTLRNKRLIHALVGTSQVTHLVGQTFGGYHTKPVRKAMRAAEALYTAKWAGKPTTLCLAMIVKDESKVILEALESVYKLIDTWCIVDTGSTDDTKEKITEFFKSKNIPGQLHTRPWVDFGHNRTEALQLADPMADYAVMMDADDIIEGTPALKNLTADCYSVKHGQNFSYWRMQVFRSGLRWRYVGVLHEAPMSDIAKTTGRIGGDYQWHSRTVGARNNDPLKYAKDAITLENALLKEPDNARYWFYLGQSYFDAGNFTEAKRAYAKRVSLGGWPEEVFYAQYRVGICAIRLTESDEQVLDHMLKAYAFKPDRAESLCSLAAYLRTKGKFAMAYPFALTAAQLPLPANDTLFVHSDIYRYQALDELAVSSYYVGRKAESLAICKRILAQPLPEAERKRIEGNMRLCEPALKR